MYPRTCLLLGLLLGGVSCQSTQSRLALEARYVTADSEESSYDEADSPVGGAFQMSSMPIQGADHRLGWELGLGQSSDSFALPAGSYDLTHREAWLGLRYSFLDGHVRPYISGGVQYTQHAVTLEFGGSTIERKTDDIGPYGEAGLLLRLNPSLHTVLGYRRTFGMEGEMSPLELDLDTRQVFLGVGLSF
ncbi:MAG: outer membrane beta-barrel protein [Planctomycetota bacterium]